MHLFDFVAAERHPNAKDYRRQGEDLEKQAEIIEHHHAMKQQARLRAVKIEGREQRSDASDNRNQRQSPLRLG
jgi:hypothetical protein